MQFFKAQAPSRREFLKRSGQLALTGAALPFALNLAAIGEAAALTSTPGDYKALVCVFLNGGNDYANTVVPYDDTSYNSYQLIRAGSGTASDPGIALLKSTLSATLLTPAVAPKDALGASNRQFALNPAMTGLATLFNAGQAAVQLNVGPLVQPLTRDQYLSNNHVANPRPPQLFSHNDQRSVWQSSSPEGATIGWGGQLGDRSPSASIYTCISVAGDNAVFLSGDSTVQYQVSPSGAIKINAAVSGASVYGSTAVSAAMRGLIQQPREHKLENFYNQVTRQAVSAEAAVSTALTSPKFAAVATDDSLMRQMKMVANLINGRLALGSPRRQVFMVQLGGFDLHDNLIRDHGALLGRVSAAMAMFYQATLDMGLAKQVTAFTASDFGRTLSSNGDGSDHGWGSHHLVVGGAVNGTTANQGQFYGTAPPISVSDTRTTAGFLPENQWHVGQGRLLPSTSVDQYAATLAKWFGVTPDEMPGVLPNIVNFGSANYPVDLGFMG